MCMKGEWVVGEKGRRRVRIHLRDGGEKLWKRRVKDKVLKCWCRVWQNGGNLITATSFENVAFDRNYIPYLGTILPHT